MPGAPAANDLDLARRYAPVLVFTAGERWTPVRVDPYVARAKLSGPAGTPAKLTDYDAVSSCPQSRPHCYTLSIECPSGSEERAHPVRRTPTALDQKSLHEEGAVYVRVVDRDALPLAQRKAIFADGGPFGERLTKLIQYWYFYEYDEWEAPVFAGLLTQRHEGDWEAVTLGLEDDRAPTLPRLLRPLRGQLAPLARCRSLDPARRAPGPPARCGRRGLARQLPRRRREALA